MNKEHRDQVHRLESINDHIRSEPRGDVTTSQGSPSKAEHFTTSKAMLMDARECTQTCSTT